MKIGIIGASGMAGQAVYKEALKRGHQPVGIVRNEGQALSLLGSEASLMIKDAFLLTKEEMWL